MKFVLHRQKCNKYVWGMGLYLLSVPIFFKGDDNWPASLISWSHWGDIGVKLSTRLHCIAIIMILGDEIQGDQMSHSLSLRISQIILFLLGLVGGSYLIFFAHATHGVGVKILKWEEFVPYLTRKEPLWNLVKCVLFHTVCYFTQCVILHTMSNFSPNV